MINQPGRNQNISMDVKYRNISGDLIDISRLERGTDFYADITITNLKTRGAHLENLALTQVFPAGWEIQSGQLTKNEKRQ